MNMQVVKKFTSLALKDYKKRKSTFEFVTEHSTKPNDGNLLCLYTSVITSKAVPLIQLPIPIKELKPEQMCKIDWHFGICNHPKDDSFDWLKELRRKRSLAIQLIIEIPKNIEFIEIYSDMMGLQPLNQILDSKPDFLNVATNVAVNIPPIKVFAELLKSLKIEIEKIVVAEKLSRRLHQFLMYRFINDKGMRGIEWSISKEIISEWGSLLRGSVYIAFYGTTSRSEQAKISLCPRLGFYPNDPLIYIPEGQPDQSTCVFDIEILESVS